MRGRKPKPTRLKVITGNPGKRPLNRESPNRADPRLPVGTEPRCPDRMAPPCRRTRQASLPHQPRSRGAGRLLQRLCPLGRSHTGRPEVRCHGQIADRLPHPVALRLDRQPPGRDHAPHRIRVRLHASQPGTHLHAAGSRAGLVRSAAPRKCRMIHFLRAAFVAMCITGFSKRGAFARLRTTARGRHSVRSICLIRS